ncbi:MAG: hypothetical protein K8R41_00670 [Bacteroidales bacterium]|nr:hypothetical protein [Bacteroidales bacterium]
MSSNFSFIGNNFENILKSSGFMLPGIEKLVAIYHNEISGKTEAKYVIRQEANVLNELSIKDYYHEIQNLRSEKQNYNWYKKDELPFETEKLTSELNIFTEIENIVLLIRLKNDIDGKFDLLFIYFNDNVSNFGVSRSDKSLSTEIKTIIGFLLYNNFKSLLNTNKQNKSILKSINENTRSLIRQTTILKSEISHTRKNYGESLINVSVQYLMEFSSNSEKSYKFSKDALDKISEFTGNINNLKSIIRKSITYVDNVYFDNNDDEIIIHACHINLYNYEVQTEVEENEFKIDDRYTKTILLLDKYERAAKKVLSEGKNLTSENLGKACPNQITAPAISFALKKYKKKIFHLFKIYPDKWEKIREEFRPVKNLFIGRRDFKERMG